MPTRVPGFAISKLDDGSVAGNFVVHSASLPTVNWTGLLQWLTTRGPNVMAAIAAPGAAFSGSTPPPPAPAPKA